MEVLTTIPTTSSLTCPGRSSSNDPGISGFNSFMMKEEIPEIENDSHAVVCFVYCHCGPCEPHTSPAQHAG